MSAQYHTKERSLRYSKIYKHINDISNITSFTHNAITGTKRILEVSMAKRKRKFWENVLEYELNLLGEREKRIGNIVKCIKEGFVDKKILKDKEENRIFYSERGCNNRCCPHCNEKIKNKWRRNLRDIALRYKNPRFVTVSFRSEEILSKDFLKKCSSQFNTTRKYLKRMGYNIENYVSIMEIKFNKRGDTISHFKKRGGKYIRYDSGQVHKNDNWNVHYHSIFDSPYIDANDFRSCFSRATKGRSFHIDIQWVGKDLINSRVKALNYITKYLSKIAFDPTNELNAIEYYKATSKMRFVKIYGIKPLKKKGKYEIFINSIRNIYKHSYYDILIMYNDYEQILHKYKINNYDLDKSVEVNVLKYADESMIYGIMGV